MNNPVAVINLSINDIEFIDKKQNCYSILEIFSEPILKLPKRILVSFIPPLVYSRQYMFTDFIGPIVSILLLIFLLQYGFNCKEIQQNNISSINVGFIILLYYVVISFFIFIVTRFVKVKLKMLDIVTLIGYSFYGFILTLFIPFIFGSMNDYIFYVCLISFGGLSCIRVLLVILFAVDLPVARFLICSLIGNVHVLFLIYLYYYYIHPTYPLRITSANV